MNTKFYYIVTKDDNFELLPQLAAQTNIFLFAFIFKYTPNNIGQFMSM